jgi:hypothetical protein
MYKNILLIVILLFASAVSNAQVSGNQVYGGDRNSGNRNILINPGIILEGDSVLYINASVLLNTPAEYYVAVFGVGQTSKTLKEGNVQINKRIDKFISSLQALGIKKQDISVDFITQTKTYDYTLSNNVATQIQTGFQIKKNVIIKFNNIAMLDNMLLNGAENEIYDLVKVDYGMNDYLALHKQMINTAAEIINEKKSIYLKTAAFELLPNSVVSRDNFFVIYPAGQYKKYQAFETSDVTSSYYESKLIKKDILTNNTFYYEGSDLSGYDKVISPGISYIPVQFVLNYSVKYYIKRK